MGIFSSSGSSLFIDFAAQKDSVKSIQLTLVALCLILAGCGVPRSGQPVAAAPFLPMATAGPESWQIAGKTYNIRCSYYLGMRQDLQYTIESEYTDAKDLEDLTESEAREIALPLMKHAFVNGFHNRTKIQKKGEDGVIVPTLIGVALFKKKGIKVSARRVNMSLAAMQALVDASPSAQTDH